MTQNLRIIIIEFRNNSFETIKMMTNSFNDLSFSVGFKYWSEEAHKPMKCRKTERMTRRRKNEGQRMFRHVFCFVFLAFVGVAMGLSADDSYHCGPSDDPIEYDWQRLDYYSILDLPQPKEKASRKARRKLRDKIDTKQIKKSYRTQAQIYHPDKAASGRNSTLTVAESTKRFSRIAEAYEVLNDESKRREYDAWLLDCEVEETDSSKSDNDNRWKNMFDNFSSAVDPRRVFEDFFYGHTETGRRQPPKKEKPLRVVETREMLYSPTTSQPILRVYQTEEYKPNRKGKCFYRVIAQDYMEQYDQYSGQWHYQPISKPTVMEEGYRDLSEIDRRQVDSILYGREFMTPANKPLKSENGRYTAGLTPECELVVVEHDIFDEDDDRIIWSSDTYVPPSHLRKNGCFMGMQGPLVVLSLGSPEYQGPILWTSEVSDDVWLEDERIRFKGGLDPQYFVRLEDDGNLVVYSERIVSDRQQPDYVNEFHAHPGYNTRAAKAWRSVRQWFRKRLSSIDDDENFTHAHGESYSTRTFCLYATGPAGCNRPGRKILRLASNISRGFKNTVKHLDQKLDDFIERIREDDDEELHDILLRVLGNAGHEVASGAQRSASAIRDFIADKRKKHRRRKKKQSPFSFEDLLHKF